MKEEMAQASICEEAGYGTIVLMSVNCCNLLPERMIWRWRKVAIGGRMLCSPFTLQDWLESFCMSQCTFTYLCNELRSSIEKRYTEMRKAVPSDMCVALTLCFLATGADYRTISHLNSLASQNQCFQLQKICVLPLLKLLPQYVTVPTGAALREVINGLGITSVFPTVLEPLMNPINYSHHFST